MSTRSKHTSSALGPLLGLCLRLECLCSLLHLVSLRAAPTSVNLSLNVIPGPHHRPTHSRLRYQNTVCGAVWPHRLPTCSPGSEHLNVCQGRESRSHPAKRLTLWCLRFLRFKHKRGSRARVSATGPHCLWELENVPISGLWGAPHKTQIPCRVSLRPPGAWRQ